MLSIIIIVWGEELFGRLELNEKVQIYSIIYILPFFLTGVPWKLKDKTFFGRIIKVKIYTRTDIGWLYKRIFPSVRNNTIVLYCLLNNGKIHAQTVYRETTAMIMEKREYKTINVDKYQEGDLVFHLYGSGQTVVLPKPSDDVVQCAICGSYVDINKEICPNCSHSLVKRMF